MRPFKVLINLPFSFSFILSLRLLENRLNNVLDDKVPHEAITNEFEKTYTGNLTEAHSCPSYGRNVEY